MSCDFKLGKLMGRDRVPIRHSSRSNASQSFKNQGVMRVTAWVIGGRDWASENGTLEFGHTNATGDDCEGTRFMTITDTIRDNVNDHLGQG